MNSQNEINSKALTEAIEGLGEEILIILNRITEVLNENERTIQSLRSTIREQDYIIEQQTAQILEYRKRDQN